MVAFGILSSGALAMCIANQAQAHSQVYASGICSCGTTYFDVCTISLPFAPFKYNVTELSWLETSNGDYISGIPQSASGSVSRRCLEVESSSGTFFLPLDFGQARTPFESIGDPPTTPTMVRIVNGSGDFAPVLIECMMNYGGRAPAKGLPELQASWTRGHRTNKDVFIFQSDQFTRIQNLLEDAYGKPDTSIRSTESSGGDCCSICYSPAQIGVFLSLARTWDDITIISVVGRQAK